MADDSCCSGSVTPIPPAASLRTTSDATFFYATATQDAPIGTADAASGKFLVADPTVKDCGHSLAEMAAYDTLNNDQIEVGWIVAPDQYSDKDPHLFIFDWVNGKAQCYSMAGKKPNRDDECGFTITDMKLLAKPLTANTTITLKIEYNQGHWMVFEDNQEVGYFFHSLWGDKFDHVGGAQWWGEVAANPTTDHPCSQMGNGQFPTSSTADTITDMDFYNGSSSWSASVTVQPTNPTYYGAVATSGNSMKFGGPGAGC
jgi:hypothetical protein